MGEHSRLQPVTRGPLVRGWSSINSTTVVELIDDHPLTNGPRVTGWRRECSPIVETDSGLFHPIALVGRHGGKNLPSVTRPTPASVEHPPTRAVAAPRHDDILNPRPVWRTWVVRVRESHPIVMKIDAICRHEPVEATGRVA